MVGVFEFVVFVALVSPTVLTRWFLLQERRNLGSSELALAEQEPVCWSLWITTMVLGIGVAAGAMNTASFNRWAMAIITLSPLRIGATVVVLIVVLVVVGALSRWRRNGGISQLWRQPRRLLITRTGKTVICVTLGLGIYCINFGNWQEEFSTAAAFLGMSYCLIIASSVLSQLSLQTLRTTRVASSDGSGDIKLEVTNRGWFPATVDFCDDAQSQPSRQFRVAPRGKQQVQLARSSHEGKPPRFIATTFPFGWFRKLLPLDL